VVMRVTWDLELERLLKERWMIKQVFNLDEVYGFDAHFQRLYPSNSHVHEKLRHPATPPRPWDRRVRGQFRYI